MTSLQPEEEINQKKRKKLIYKGASLKIEYNQHSNSPILRAQNNPKKE
jgi:hypothetical protein